MIHSVKNLFNFFFIGTVMGFEKFVKKIGVFVDPVVSGRGCCLTPVDLLAFANKKQYLGLLCRWVYYSF